jgi:hypothetical protein
MDLGRAFSYVFDDDQWLTVILLGGLLMIVPIFGQIVLLGFMIAAARNVMQGSPNPLPRWDNLGDKFMQGLYALGIQLVYALPIVIPIILLACVATGLGAAAGSEDAAAATIVSLFLCLMPILIILGLVLQVFGFAATVRYLQTNSFSSAMQFGEVIRMVRSDIGGWVVLWLLYLLCSIVASAGSIAFGVGVLFTTVYSQAVFGHLLGQKARQNMVPANDYGFAPPTTPL